MPDTLDDAAESVLFLLATSASGDLPYRRTWALAVLRRASDRLTAEIEDAAKVREDS